MLLRLLWIDDDEDKDKDDDDNNDDDNNNDDNEHDSNDDDNDDLNRIQNAFVSEGDLKAW